MVGDLPGRIGGRGARGVSLAPRRPIAGAASLEAKSVGLPMGIPSIDEAIEEFRRGRDGRALELLEDAVARRPSLPPAKLMLARMMLAVGRDAPARSVLEEVVADHPNRTGAYLLFGNLALSEGRVADASLQFEKALSLVAKEFSAPDSPPAKEIRVQCASGLASIAERRRAWGDARRILSGWVALEPRNGSARRRLARALVHLGQVDESHGQLQQAVQDDPTLEPAAVGVGRFVAEAGRREEAGRWFERAVREAPKDPRAHLGWRPGSIRETIWPGLGPSPRRPRGSTSGRRRRSFCWV
jgi:Flp pilus assembly protein TadD